MHRRVRGKSIRQPFRAFSPFAFLRGLLFKVFTEAHEGNEGVLETRAFCASVLAECAARLVICAGVLAKSAGDFAKSAVRLANCAGDLTKSAAHLAICEGVLAESAARLAKSAGGPAIRADVE
jgi:hypothetical protein